MNTPKRRNTDLPPSAFRLPPSPRGFTLVELLVTITIIGLLAAMTLGALQWARSYAAEEKTKATIAKLDAIVMKRYESYATRRLPITIPLGTSPAIVAQAKIFLLRELMRMEMPERDEDIQSLTNPYVLPSGDQIIIPDSALKIAYNNKLLAAKTYLVGTKGMNSGDADNLIGVNQQAECLYMIVAIGSPADMEQFNQNEIGDTDGDSLPEFLDGWGKPICFLRWAPGFNQSGVQANINTSWHDATALAQRTQASKDDHESFDSRKTDITHIDKGLPGEPTHPTGWRLMPLIYSAGPDQEYGICGGIVYIYNGNPYESIQYISPSGQDYRVGIGAPIPDKPTQILDNITNHQIEMK